MMRFVMRRIAALFSLLIVAFAAAPVPVRAQGVEEIRLFESRIVVGEDGALTVTEIITVNAQWGEIKRGIYRDFPTRYYDPDNGLLRTASFEVLRVTRDGLEEPWFTQGMGGGTRVYIGDKDKYVSRGIHTYELVYRTDRQLRYFEGYDELYWNVTGNGWSFPIRVARAQVTLPPGAEVLEWYAYTGGYGSTGQNAQVIGQTRRTITIETTRRLGAREGLTVAIAFPKGFVPEVTPNQAFRRMIWDNLGLFGFLAAIPGIIGFLFYHWVRVGRDPPRQSVIPRFESPRHLSPGALSYLHYRGFRKGWRSGASKAFIAALTSLAVKGRIVIDQTGKNMAVEARERGYNAMSPDEQALDTALLGGTRRREFKKANRSAIVSAISKFRSAITKSYGEVYYTTNRRYVIYALAMLILAALFFLFLDRPAEDITMPVIFAGIFGGVGLTLMSVGLARVFGVGEGSWFSALLMTFFALPFALVPLLMIVLVPGGMIKLVPLLIYLTMALIVLFGWLMPAPTVEGQRLSEEIEGYKLYLSVAEEKRMNMKGAPLVTPEVYETHLPYAIGLGVEKQWSNAFAEALAKAGRSEADYHPGFYRGSTWNTHSIARASSGMASAIGSSIASATPSKSSSSGSSGGGFSGGGGGGGGGGGW
ncbi:MAG: DUF2207 domain-containing protein [Rhodobiaceae bacterium]|nr:DUF2207 domain-containing protein [Rhodobiaceae bacterium]MCC0049466.1 DUF2207 domain-containing protein [Rhodobiaceae bacterium]